MGKWGAPFAANIWGPFRGWFVTVTGLAVDGAGNVFAAEGPGSRATAMGGITKYVVK